MSDGRLNEPCGPGHVGKHCQIWDRGGKSRGGSLCKARLRPTAGTKMPWGLVHHLQGPCTEPAVYGPLGPAAGAGGAEAGGWRRRRHSWLAMPRGVTPTWWCENPHICRARSGARGTFAWCEYTMRRSHPSLLSCPSALGSLRQGLPSDLLSFGQRGSPLKAGAVQSSTTRC